MSPSRPSHKYSSLVEVLVNCMSLGRVARSGIASSALKDCSQSITNGSTAFTQANPVFEVA